VYSVCNRNQQPRETLKPHPVPSRPWQRIGVDLFTFHQRNYLITVDFYSGWFELDLLSGIVASAVILKLKSQMARHRIPDVLMSNNGPQFCCKQFKEFSQKWEFIHVTSSPVYPQSNGGVERAVQTAKTLMKKLSKVEKIHICPY
jgi:transposase InsO family protein